MCVRVSAQDINKDGYGDIAIGHALADPVSGNSAGATYVILGGGGILSPLNVLTDLDGSNGFVLHGDAEGDRSGTSVSGAGVSTRENERDRESKRSLPHVSCRSISWVSL